jgi:hypothetical protein
MSKTAASPSIEKEAALGPVVDALDGLGRVEAPLLERDVQHKGRVLPDVGEHLGAFAVVVDLLSAALTADLLLIGVVRHGVKELQLIVRAGELTLRVRHHLVDNELFVFVRHPMKLLGSIDPLRSPGFDLFSQLCVVHCQLGREVSGCRRVMTPVSTRVLCL